MYQKNLASATYVRCMFLLHIFKKKRGGLTTPFALQVRAQLHDMHAVAEVEVC